MTPSLKGGFRAGALLLALVIVGGCGIEGMPIPPGKVPPETPPEQPAKASAQKGTSPQGAKPSGGGPPVPPSGENQEEPAGGFPDK